jgi:hypothetical protein
MNLAGHTGVEGLTTAMRRQGKEKFRPDASKKLREQVHEVMRYFHYARRTELAYWHWIERFLRFHKEREGRVAASPRAGRQGGDGVLDALVSMTSSSPARAASSGAPETCQTI